MNTSQRQVRITTIIPLSNYSPATSHLLADISKFSLELGFNIVKIPRAYLSQEGFPKIWREFYGMPKYASAIKKSDILLIPYPAVFNPMYPSMVLNYHDLKSIYNLLEKRKYIAFVFDLPIERRQIKETSRYSVEIEKKFFENANVILTFNPYMDNILKERYDLDDKTFIHFEILDCYTKFIPLLHKNIDYPRKVVLAGNLSKRYVGEEIVNYFREYHGDDIIFTLFGKYQPWIGSLHSKSKIRYGGFISNRMELHREISKHDFGILSYSSTILPYLKFTSTSKFSTYIASGVPVIAPIRAKYLSEVINKYNVGITYKNSLEKAILKITSRKYAKLRQNVLDLAEKIRNGYFFKNAVRQALESLGITF